MVATILDWKMPDSNDSIQFWWIWMHEFYSKLLDWISLLQNFTLQTKDRTKMSIGIPRNCFAINDHAFTFEFTQIDASSHILHKSTVFCLIATTCLFSLLSLSLPLSLLYIIGFGKMIHVHVNFRHILTCKYKKKDWNKQSQ